jgi:superfamily I DNA/RNA helicase
MRERLVDRLGESGKKVRVSTLHSFALSELLGNEGLGLEMPLRVVGDWEERNVVVEELKRFLGRSVHEIQDCLTRLSDDWDTLAADGTGWEDGYPDPLFLSAWRLHRGVYGYTLRSELVYQLLIQMRSDDEFTPGAGTDVLLVDEYQDLNSCDLSTVELVAARSGAEVFATGDDDQSIYSFRHAHPAGIRNFESEYPSATRRTLEECLRCGPAIVSIANWLIEQEHGRSPKTLRSVTDWGASVHLMRFDNQSEEAAEMGRLIELEVSRGTRPEEILILLKSDRDGKMSRLLDEQLVGRGLGVYQPRQGAGTDDELQELFEFLVLAGCLATEDRIDDLALRALLELRPNGIGNDRLWHVVSYCLETGSRFCGALETFRANPSQYPGRGLGSLLAEVDTILLLAHALQPNDDEGFTDWVERAFGVLGVSNDKRQQLDAILEPLVAEFENTVGLTNSERDFLSALAGAMTSVGDTRPAHVEGQVTITTMHGAKGLSAEVVVVLQAEDEIIPGGASGPELDEARRLLYVSLTRAKQSLIVTACRRRTGNQRFVGQTEITRRNLTRFLVDYGLSGETVEAYFSSAAFLES